MYSKEDYLKMLRERDKHHIDLKEWSFCQSKVMCIATAMVAAGDDWMVHNIIDELSNLSECECDLTDGAVQLDLWILESNGYKKEAKELREML